MSQQITGVTGTPTLPTVMPENNGGAIAIGDNGHINIQTGVFTYGAVGLGAGNMNLESKDGQQMDRESYQELMSFVSRCAQNWGVDGLSVMVHLRMLLNTLLLNTEVRRAYLP